MKHRLERVNELIKRELGELITREVSFQAALVTVQHVDITPDLKQAHVFVSVIGSAADAKAAMSTLHASRAVLQNQLSKRVILKYTPHLHFKLDESIERGTRVINILEQIEIPPDEPDLPTEPNSPPDASHE